MKTILLLSGLAAMTIATPASASHFMNLTTPYESRGACEAAVADFSSDDREMLLDRFPQFFVSIGDVASFLTRAFTCELNPADDQWYIKDHRAEVLASDWYQNRHD